VKLLKYESFFKVICGLHHPSEPKGAVGQTLLFARADLGRVKLGNAFLEAGTDEASIDPFRDDSLLFVLRPLFSEHLYN
jgi:hypothetical protein